MYQPHACWPTRGGKGKGVNRRACPRSATRASRSRPRQPQRSCTRQMRKVDADFDVDVDGDGDGDLNVVATFDKGGCFLCATARHPMSMHRIC
jgi:hypothetical protein